MSQPTTPVSIPGKQETEEKRSPRSETNSREASPSSSPGSKRKREEDDHDNSPNDEDIHQNKKRRTPPIDSAAPASETPRVGQIQERVEKMRVNRMSGGPVDSDVLRELAQTPDTPASQPEKDASQPKEVVPVTTSPKDKVGESGNTNEESQGIEADTDEPPAIVDTEMSQPFRRRPNGLKRIVNLDRPIELDQDYNRKRKASEKLAGSPFSSPAAKRAKEDVSTKPTIEEEERSDLNITKPPSTPATAASSPAKPVLKGFSAFASAASPFASVTRTENAPFGGGTRPSTLFGGSNAPIFKSPFPVVSPFSTPKSSGTTSPFKSNTEDTDPAQGLAKSTTPFPQSGSPSFGTPSSAGVSGAPKAVFGRSSGFGMATSPSPTPSAVGPTRRAKSPRPQAFGAYGATAARFAAPSGKIRAKNQVNSENGDTKESDGGTSGEEKGDEDKAKRFSEILAATGSDAEVSDAEKMVFTEQETMTGEEDEMNIFHARGKLYEMESGSWKERGPGLFKLNVNKETGKSARIVMRRDGSLNLLLNAMLFKGMVFSAGHDPRYITFTILDEKLQPKSHLLRFPSAKHAQDLLDRVQVHIPQT